jgi:hypothetical protein
MQNSHDKKLEIRLLVMVSHMIDDTKSLLIIFIEAGSVGIVIEPFHPDGTFNINDGTSIVGMVFTYLIRNSCYCTVTFFLNF